MQSTNLTSEADCEPVRVLLTPGPLTTSDPVRRAMTRDWATRDQDFRELTARVRTRLLEVSGLGRDFTCVPVAGSGTSAIEAALGTLIPRAGKVLVIVNGAYGKRLADLCRILKLEHSALEFSATESLSLPEVSAALARDTSITHIAVVHCETSSGMLNPVHDVVDLAARLGRGTIIDAMSTFGGLPTPVGAGVSAVISSANKCLEGAPGVAFVLAREHDLIAAEGTSPSLTLDLSAQFAALCSTGEWRFTAPTHVLAALEQSLSEHEQEGGTQARGRRYRANYSIVIERLTAAGLKPLLDADLRSPIIVSFLQPDERWFDFEVFYAAVRARGFILYPGKVRGVATFRVGCIGHVDDTVLDGATTAIINVLSLMKEPTDARNPSASEVPRPVPVSKSSFPPDFVWGAATAAYQIEGASEADGKGASVWDMFCKKPGAVWSDHTGDVACDHYRRHAEDVRLMKQIGLKGYRFSLSWPRLFPNGLGRENSAGFDFYDRLIDDLLAANIQPWATLFHWDYPLELYRRGGWLNQDSPAWFAEYAGAVVRRFSDRVAHWITLNEPQCFFLLGHSSGAHAPGDKLSDSEVVRGIHHVLVAHGEAVQAIRANSKQPTRVGYAPFCVVPIPETETPRDIAAARKRCFAVQQGGHWDNGTWMDPVFLGRYPEDALRNMASKLPAGWEADLNRIHQPLDFFGANIYSGKTVRAGQNEEPELVTPEPGFPITGNAWQVTPSSLSWGPRFFHERYKRPIVITENGLSARDWVALDGRVHDNGRIDFMRQYLQELHRAIDDGVDVSGYFHWSLLDNFEWAEGYKERFGLIHVDYQTQKRTLKDSAMWYGRIIAENGASLVQQRCPSRSCL